MAYPKILQRLFENSGAGPRLRKEILPFGSTPGTACEGDDARLSNARVPQMHKETHQMGGADALTPEDIGAHPADGMASAGKAGIARLSSAVDMDSEDQAATPKAVKVTHELAASAKADAAAAQARADSAHAEAERAASTTSSGRVQLSSALNSDSEALAATPKAVKAVYSEAVKSASLTQAGRVKLNNTVSSTSAAEAATANAVKTAYDKAVEASRIPTATATVLGVVRIGEGIEVDGGVISVPLATDAAPGLVRPDGTTCTVDSAGVLSVAASGPSYDPASGQVTYPGYVGEFRNFMLAAPPLGWAVRNGAVLSQADIRYSKLWAALNSSGMAFLKKTLEQWDALSNAAGGVGGVPFFVVDTTAKTIKLPDTRGDYERGAGSSYLETVGAWHPGVTRPHFPDNCCLPTRQYYEEMSMIVYQHDNHMYYAGQCEDYNGPLPHNCVRPAPPALPWDRVWPRWNGEAWELIEDHRARRVEDGFAPEQIQAATDYWLPDAGDDWQSPAREMKEIGPLPAGAVTRQPEQPAPTLEEAKAAKLDEIDSQTSAAILAGFDYTVNGENLHFSYDSFDQQNFADTANACLLAQSGVAGLPESVTWNAYQGEARELVRLTLTATQFLELYTAGALAHKAAKMAWGGERKAAVEAAQTRDALREI